MPDIKYSIKYIHVCNMCGATEESFSVLGKRLNKSQGKNPAKKTGLTTTVCKCNNCGLVFANPLPIPENINDHYGVPPETYWKDEYFKVDENYFITEIEWLKKLMDIKPGMKSLDIGAGIGKQMIALEKIGFDAYGLEPSIPFHERAISKMNIRPDKLKLTSIEAAEYDHDYFDFISFGVVLEHLYDPSDAIKKALKWLKPGGLIHVEVPSSKWLINRVVNFAYKIKGLDYVGNISPMHTPFHLYEFTVDSFKENSKRNNYKIKDYCHYVCQTYMPKIISPIFTKYMEMTNTGMQLCIWLEK